MDDDALFFDGEDFNVDDDFLDTDVAVLDEPDFSPPADHEPEEDDHGEYFLAQEEAASEEDLASLAFLFDDSSMFLSSKGVAPAPRKGTPVDAVRAKVFEDIQGVIMSDETGAWLVRHPPGTGKTTAFAEVVGRAKFGDDFLPFFRPVLGCAPTVAEAEALSRKTGIPVLRAQGPLNCQQMADEQESPKAERRLHNHLAAGHVGSDFCQGCRHLGPCTATRGQYRHDQREFRQSLHRKGRLPQAITTVKMLETLAPALNDSVHRMIIWTDEDLFPHMRQEVLPIALEEISDWIMHAEVLTEVCPSIDVEFMKKVRALVASVPIPEKGADTYEDHGTEHGRRVMLTGPALAEVLELLERSTMEERTHPTEKIGGDGAELAPGMWRRAMFSQVRLLMRGVPYVWTDNKRRGLSGYAINRHLKALPAKHCFLQSDATAAEPLWRGVWGKHWRRMLDAAPERKAEVIWWPSVVLKSKDSAFDGAMARLKTIMKQHPGRIGILTFMDWTLKMRDALLRAGISVHLLPRRDKDGRPIGTPVEGPTSARVILGHFGAHDRGVNDYHLADLDAFFVVGSHRPPMSEYHARAAVYAALGVELPKTAQAPRKMFPMGADGMMVSQRAHRAMQSPDPRTNWISDHERGAHLAQALERVRSVDRAAKGMPSIPVYLWGPEACRPTIPLPIRYSLA